MAIALEALSPEAQAAAASKSPEVAAYLSRQRSAGTAAGAPKTARKPSPAWPARRPASPSSRTSATSTRSSSSTRSSTPRSVLSDVDRATPGPGRGNILAKLILAGAVGILILEVIAQVTGNYFSYDLRKPLANPKGQEPYRPLYASAAANPHNDPNARLSVGASPGQLLTP